MKSEHKRKQKALEEAIALLEANAQAMNSGPWYVAEVRAKKIFEEMQRGEMDGFEQIRARWVAQDEYAIAVLCKLAELHILSDKLMPDYLKFFVVIRLIEPTAVPNIVNGKLAGFVPAKGKRGPQRYNNFSRDNAIINIVRLIKEKYGYEAIRGDDKRSPDSAPSAASIVAEASKIVGLGTGPSKRGQKRSQKGSVDESTISNLWSRRDKRFDGRPDLVTQHPVDDS